MSYLICVNLYQLILYYRVLPKYKNKLNNTPTHMQYPYIKEKKQHQYEQFSSCTGYAYMNPNTLESQALLAICSMTIEE